MADEATRPSLTYTTGAPVAFTGVEPQREAAGVALGIGRAALAGHRNCSKADTAYGAAVTAAIQRLASV